VNGQASYSTSFATPANHFITASYSGDSNYGAGSAQLVEEVRYGSTTTLTSSANPSVYSQPVTLTATVSAVAPGTATPTGMVVFLDGTTLLGTAFLNSSGQATLTVSTLSVATHSITANYNGDILYVASASTALSQVVNRDGTTTTLVSSLNPSVFGQAVTFTATVTANAPGTAVPTGNVVFTDGSTTLATVALSSTGTASFTTSTLTVGTHNIKASYKGGKQFIASQSAVLVQTVTASSPSRLLLVAGGGEANRTSAEARRYDSTAWLASLGASSAIVPGNDGGQLAVDGALGNPGGSTLSTLRTGKTTRITASLGDLDRFFAILGVEDLA
jgi:hypothetical protein